MERNTRAGAREWIPDSTDVDVDGTRFRIAYAESSAPVDPHPAQPILYLHGLGSSRLDFATAIEAPELDGHRLIALDLPGSGQSRLPAHAGPGIEELTVAVERVIATIAPDGVHLVGHSMGGLIGLLAASRGEVAVRTFANVEGNLAPIDCRVFSRRAIELAKVLSARDVVGRLATELEAGGRPGYVAFARRFRDEIDAETFIAYCRSIVGISERVPLLSAFIGMDIPRLFVYGERNRDLDYLPQLKSGGVAVAEIPHSDHFPLYSNPKYFYATIANFVRDA